jgi:hypothetical protein
VVHLSDPGSVLFLPDSRNGSFTKRNFKHLFLFEYGAQMKKTNLNNHFRRRLLRKLVVIINAYMYEYVAYIIILFV